MNVLIVTANRGKCCNLGDRLPAVLLKTDTQQFHIGTQIGTNGNKYATSTLRYVTNTMYLFKIRQYESSGKMVRFITVSITHLKIKYISSILKQALMVKHSLNAQKIQVQESLKMYI